MTLKTFRLTDDISLIQEIGVAKDMRCNIWHIKGRDYDLVIDTGMGLNPLKQWVMQDTDRPIKAIGTHSHFDHCGSFHEFECRLGHRAEAEIYADPTQAATAFVGGWKKIDFVSPKIHSDYSGEDFTITPAPLTGYLDEGDVLDMGDRAFQILHLPGHSPGSIGLWEMKTKTLFSGDALYDGELLDNHYHSEPEVYHQTLRRIQSLGAETFHAGHFPSFGKERMNKRIEAYFAGHSSLEDVETWWEGTVASGKDQFTEQNWSRAKTC